MQRLRDRIRRARRPRHGLDYLLSQSSPDAPLPARLTWLVEVLEWVRQPALVAHAHLDFATGQGQAARVRHMLQVLAGNDAMKRRFASTVRTTLRDVDALELFRSTGLPGGLGLWAEISDRFSRKILPAHADGNDLGDAFDVLFPSATDAAWLERLDEATLVAVRDLVGYGVTTLEANWNSLPRDMQQALLLLAGEAQVLAFLPLLRRRRGPNAGSQFPALFDEARAFARTLVGSDAAAREASYAALIRVAELARCELEALRVALRHGGVSLDLVYTIERLEALVDRMLSLAAVLSGANHPEQAFVTLLLRLITANERRRSIAALWQDMFALLSRRITERNADTGDHYITRDAGEYGVMISRSFGGGAITAVTVVIKLASAHMAGSSFVKGVFLALNYSTSFLAIQALGFTLATKQPAMTAPVIAAHAADLRSDAAVQRLVKEIFALIRSQVAAVLGNLLAVVPFAAGLVSLAWLGSHHAATSAEAEQILADHSLLSMTPLYAAFTGVLLWISSLAAGWTDNWVAYHRLGPAVAGHRRLRFFLGARGAERLAGAIVKHAAAIGGNVSLGFMLGLLPKILVFLGIPLDVRHVTLSAGTITVAAMELGRDVFDRPEFWWAIAGVAAIGVLNVSISFALAMTIAVRARKVSLRDRDRLYRALRRRILRHPLQLLLPVGLSRKGKQSTAV